MLWLQLEVMELFMRCSTLHLTQNIYLHKQLAKMNGFNKERRTYSSSIYSCCINNGFCPTAGKYKLVLYFDVKIFYWIVTI
jgi:hypothetical protein